jgi:hypothetical protein
MTVVATLARPGPVSSRTLDQRILYLGLVHQGEVWPLASGPIDRDRVEWHLTGLASTLGLPVGPLPSSLFALSLDEPLGAHPAPSRWLQGELLDAEGMPLPGRTVPVQIRGVPHWEAGTFSVEIALPLETRLACPDHLLLLDVVVSAHTWQRLGCWPVRDWQEEARLLTTRCPDRSAIAVASASLLRARLQPPA